MMQNRGMAIIILPDGSIKVESEADLKTALAYQRLKAASEGSSTVTIKPQPKIPKPPAQPQLNLGQHDYSISEDERLLTADVFLRTIADGGQSGVQAETLQEALQVSAPRGMGAKVFSVKNALKEAGIAETDEVFRRERTPLGGIWQPGPRIQEAIELVNGLLAKGQK